MSQPAGSAERCKCPSCGQEVGVVSRRDKKYPELHNTPTASSSTKCPGSRVQVLGPRIYRAEEAAACRPVG
jgi:hypothetical protein